MSGCYPCLLFGVRPMARSSLVNSFPNWPCRHRFECLDCKSGNVHGGIVTSSIDDDIGSRGSRWIRLAYPIVARAFAVIDGGRLFFFWRRPSFWQEAAGSGNFDGHPLIDGAAYQDLKSVMCLGDVGDSLFERCHWWRGMVATRCHFYLGTEWSGIGIVCFPKSPVTSCWHGSF